MTIIHAKQLEILENIKYGGRKGIVNRCEDYVLTKPLNSWDMNYRLYDLQEKKVYLVDIDDVQDSVDDLDEYGGISHQDLILLDIDMIKEVAWKIEKE